MLDLIARLTTDLSADLQALTLTGARANAALRVAVSGVLATLVALALHLDNPWWAAITGLVIVQSHLAATLTRSADRIIGTTIGAAVGFLGSAAVADHLLFLLIVVASTGFVLYAQARAEHGYAYLLGGVTVVIVMFSALTGPESDALRIPVWRWAEICVGVAAAGVVDFVLAPTSAAQPAAAPKPRVWAPPLDRELLVDAAAGGIAIGLIPPIWVTLDLPGLGQTPITAFVVLTAMRQEPAWKAATRLTGCLFGGVYGLMAMHFAGGEFLPWLLLLFLGLYLAGHIAQGAGDAAYVGLQAGVAIVIAMVHGAGPSSDVAPALDRLTGIVGGVIFVSLCYPILAPLVSWVVRPRR